MEDYLFLPIGFPRYPMPEPPLPTISPRQFGGSQLRRNQFSQRQRRKNKRRVGGK